ncbi:E3 ubiquitin-protein ligase TRIM39-like isoform X7 [Erpetoichthys calabaricus]|uniref:E3 ubiquitin-protein ligase TRIM39-like isoform X2 n=1 Tax=Erpetoichthys calabaricus TaxID=27687 RepID=UPI002234A323|nr:E3 ubiquitin-protein ligase TRIM39-like isoform X2 [Erpetoichthys calabaricus]XP_051778340.1 E3 ubiquitin-protein ligase TRIM39-like isoform X3 [Erpetoichthys calabaricus]XP_051778341.1 E3 ubiquitin-protein ligase TRIM39-like isoform X4 [Erpetoichthys calabaricus]XP_051778342.1 E3 ubiquitin-protein ligase TRIM39-like isoform X5 [Erpetoichthys calabaricus]XP_051778343.1 E3 ubiquitin-protein ligase TRIM39-like isoform X6 [Erpetoichthys calabaricus]XP_051778344.1 E3 ubiquitin-protein ligase TR
MKKNMMNYHGKSYHKNHYPSHFFSISMLCFKIFCYKYPSVGFSANKNEGKRCLQTIRKKFLEGIFSYRMELRFCTLPCRLCILPYFLDMDIYIWFCSYMFCYKIYQCLGIFPPDYKNKVESQSKSVPVSLPTWWMYFPALRLSGMGYRKNFQTQQQPPESFTVKVKCFNEVESQSKSVPVSLTTWWMYFPALRLSGMGYRKNFQTQQQPPDCFTAKVKCFNEEKSEENEALKEETENQRKAFEKLQEENKALKKETENQRKAFEKLQEENKALKKETENQRKAFEKLKEENRALKKGKLQEENEALRKENVELRKAFSAEKYILDYEWIKMNEVSSSNQVLLSDTEHPELHVSDDCKQVRFKETSHQSERSEMQWPCVFGKEKLTGSHTWDVEVGEKSSWALGVTENIENIKEKRYIPVAHEQGNWIITLWKGKKFQANFADLTDLQHKPKRIRVHLDCENKRLLFIDIETRLWIHKYEINPSEQFYPIFSPGTSDKGPLILFNSK